MATGTEVQVKDYIRDAGSPIIWHVRYMDEDHVFCVGVGNQKNPDDVINLTRVIGRRTFDQDYDWEIIPQ